MKPILVVIPYYKEYEDVKPLIVGLESCLRYKFIVKAIPGTIIFEARNEGVAGEGNFLIEQTPSDDYYAIWFLDSDMTATLYDGLKLLSNLEKVEAVCAPYVIHGSETIYQCGEWDKLKGLTGRRYTTKFPSKGILPIDWAGAGCLMVRATVLDKIPYPWFYHTMLYWGKNREYRKPLGEDLSFCLYLQDYGFQLYCDFDLHIGHRDRVTGEVH